MTFEECDSVELCIHLLKHACGGAIENMSDRLSIKLRLNERINFRESYFINYKFLEY
jgi:hypothetical protein